MFLRYTMPAIVPNPHQLLWPRKTSFEKSHPLSFTWSILLGLFFFSVCFGQLFLLYGKRIVWFILSGRHIVAVLYFKIILHGVLFSFCCFSLPDLPTLVPVMTMLSDILSWWLSVGRQALLRKQPPPGFWAVMFWSNLPLHAYMLWLWPTINPSKWPSSFLLTCSSSSVCSSCSVTTSSLATLLIDLLHGSLFRAGKNGTLSVQTGQQAPAAPKGVPDDSVSIRTLKHSHAQYVLLYMAVASGPYQFSDG